MKYDNDIGAGHIKVPVPEQHINLVSKLVDTPNAKQTITSLEQIDLNID